MNVLLVEEGEEERRKRKRMKEKGMGNAHRHMHANIEKREESVSVSIQTPHQTTTHNEKIEKNYIFILIRCCDQYGNWFLYFCMFGVILSGFVYDADIHCASSYAKISRLLPAQPKLLPFVDIWIKSVQTKQQVEIQ